MADMALDMHGATREWSIVMDLIDERYESKRDVNLWAIVAGALAGALAGYVLITPRGRRALEKTIVTLDDFAASWARFSQAVGRAHFAASEGWTAIAGAIGSKSTRSR
jgi:hypothetical protein